MLSNTQAKYINSLKIKKYRQEHQAFIVEGEKSVAELLRSHFEVTAVYGLENWITENNRLLNKGSYTVQVITQQELEKVSDLTTPNKVIAVAKIPAGTSLPGNAFQDIILALDGIRDPGNLGTIIRTADWFGIGQIICSPDCVDVYNPKVIQATMGSFARVNVHYTPLMKFVDSRPSGTPVFGALLQGEELTGKKFVRPGILVIGNESQGISQELIPLITDPLFIPSFPLSSPGGGQAESLNASVANAIICYEIRKQLFENKI